MTPTREPSVTANEAADRLRDYWTETGMIRTFGPDLDAALRTERLRVVEQIRNEVGLDEGWEQRPLGPKAGSWINAFDLDDILDAVAGLERIA